MRSIRSLAAAALAAAPLSLAGAYSVQPMIYTLAPGGSGATVRLTVDNTRGTPLNVELEPYAVTADDAGKRSFTPAPDDFLIFPPQASIAGDRSQLFQIRYVGSAAMAKGRVYVLRVHQTNTIDALKVDPGATAQTRLALSLNFNTTAIVQPKQLVPRVEIEREAAIGADGLVHARLINRGDGVADLTRIEWAVERAGKRDPIGIQDLKYGDAIFLEPGRSRDVTLAGTIKGPVRLVPGTSGDGRGAGRS